MTSPCGVVIVGGGQAAAQVADALRRRQYAGPITLVSDEPVAPYQRPPLSKQYLTGQHADDWLAYRPADFYATRSVSLRLGQRVAAVSPARKTIVLDDDDQLSYDKLVLATGARARTLDVPGDALRGVHTLRTLSDAAAIRDEVAGATNIVIIGGGFIGLEVAAVLASSGRDITVLEREPGLLPRVAAPTIAEFLRGLHARHGVRIETGITIEGIEGTGGRVSAVRAGGRSYPAQLVVVGVGAVPNTELAAAAGLECDNGIVVDEFAQTADPDILAVGDCASGPNPMGAGRIRFETVHNAVEQAKTAALTILGHRAAYRQVPWVWSDQFAHRLQKVGTVRGHDRYVVRGDPQTGRFSVLYFAAGRLLGADTVNRPREFAACRRLLADGVALTVDQAADPGTDLDALAPRPARMEFNPDWQPRRRAYAVPSPI